ncbi:MULTISPECIES: ABC transporter permease [unclassified Marinitoga]|uniref:ABC transporter permease n=1 Tax=unclassified Marinitoga TaxID=2640159 RepID=UPI000640C35E|nr:MULTISPECIES: ABC transporter permease [unclassified Marinitoga]KLO24667.1 hypothetical protein X274_02620 [Marinitoga sp. 1155]NUU98896.1 hypothetical protein [Marinitoga sp. 1154]
MKKILKLAYFQFKNDMREFDSFFWSFIFPLILFFILVSIFGSMKNTENIDLSSLKVGVVYEKELSGFSKIIIEKTFNNVPFEKEIYENVDAAIKKLKNKELNAVLYFPAKFSLDFNTSLMGLKKKESNIDIYYVKGRSDSNITKDILKTFFEYVNIEILKRINETSAKKIKEININKVSITTLKNEFSYKDFVFPGILVLSIMSVGFFNIPFNILFAREKGINKRFLIIPINGFSYFFSLIISSFLMVVISSVFVIIEAIIMKVSTKFFSFEFLIFYIFSIIIIFSLGLMFISISKKLSTAMALINIIFQVSMFLGGLYFPVFNVSWAIKWFVYINPITYLVEGMRRIVGFNLAPFQNHWVYIIPMIWGIFSIVIFSVNYKRVMGYE